MKTSLNWIGKDHKKLKKFKAYFLKLSILGQNFEKNKLNID